MAKVSDKIRELMFAVINCNTIDEVNKIVDNNLEWFIGNRELSKLVCNTKNRIQKVETEKVKNWKILMN